MGIWQNKKQKNYKRRWFSLGSEYGAGSQYDFYAEYKKYLAKDNLNMMKGYCSVSYPLMLMIIALTCTAIGWKVIYILPFVAGTAVIAVLHILLVRGVGKSNPVKTAYLMVTVFNVVWYVLVILYDGILQPHEPTIRGCLVFVLLVAIFNTLPLANMLGRLLAYLAFMACDLIFADAAVIHMDRADAKSIPIVAMSANAFSDDVQGSIAAGMNAHIMKPIDSSKLKNTIQDVLKMASMKKMTEL